MRRQRGKALLTVFMALLLLTACRKAPEVSDDDEILRAKGSSEDAVAAIVNGNEESEEKTEAEFHAGAGEAERAESPAGAGQAEGAEFPAAGAGFHAAPEKVCVVLGDGENRMKIEAEIAAAPEALSVLTMQADSRLDEEALRAFLEPQGEVRDITEKLLADEEAERKRVEEIDKKLGEGSSIVEMPGAGDGSRLALTDGNRKAVLVGKTGGSFEDALLVQKCRAAAKECAEELDVKGGESGEAGKAGETGEAGDASFSLADAKELLLRKLSLLGIEDICMSKAYVNEMDEFQFYELQFSPVVNGLPLAYCFGQQNTEDVSCQGMAWVCPEGVAQIELWNCCMEQVSAGEKQKILSWEQVRKVLETYLSDGSLQCVTDVPFSTAELVRDVQWKDGKLELVPVWSIHTEMDAYVDYLAQNGGRTFVWNIYIDAVTGKLVRAQT